MLREPTVFIVDDDPSMLDSLRYLIESMQLRVQTFSSPLEFLQKHDSEAPGCLVLDVRMPEMSGLDLQEELRKNDVQLPVIIMTAHADVPTSVRAFKSGAVDFLEKNCSDQDLLDCIQRAIAKDAENRKERAQIEAIRKRLESLTARERQVLDLVVSGEPNKGIARELGLSIKTVEAHRSRVMQKMEADSMAELVRLSVTVQGAKAPARNAQAAD